MIRLIAYNDKNMSNGMRNISKTPLTETEIEFIKSEIRAIKADESFFIFNDERHILGDGTAYNFIEDKVYVTKNVLPDNKYGSTHPRDLMSVRAVLAHEYYGHRTYRDEYLSDFNKGNNFHTIPIWQDECRASITAAKITPNLSEKDKSNLVMDAVYRAQEYGNLIEMDDFMKEVLYGYSADEKHITNSLTPIHYVSKPSEIGTTEKRIRKREMPKMSRTSIDYDDFER